MHTILTTNKQIKWYLKHLYLNGFIVWNINAWQLEISIIRFSRGGKNSKGIDFNLLYGARSGSTLTTTTTTKTLMATLVFEMKTKQGEKKQIPNKLALFDILIFQFQLCRFIAAIAHFCLSKALVLWSFQSSPFFNQKYLHYMEACIFFFSFHYYYY